MSFIVQTCAYETAFPIFAWGGGCRVGDVGWGRGTILGEGFDCVVGAREGEHYGHVTSIPNLLFCH